MFLECRDSAKKIRRNEGVAFMAAAGSRQNDPQFLTPKKVEWGLDGFVDPST